MTTLPRVHADWDLDTVGRNMHGFAAELYPICRSITGEGLRETLRTVAKRIPLRLVEVPSGTRVFDWTVPKEWSIRDAYIRRKTGEKVVDFQRSNLHVLNYSAPVRATVPLDELKPHLSTLPESPEWIPYRTSYYEEKWGFCLTHRQMLGMQDEEYEVCIDSTLEDGSLTYGECYLPGESKDEVLFSCHSCHPSLADDNLSGVAVATFLTELLLGREHHYSYRFLFIPGTIGAITWLAQNRESTANIRHGLVLTCIGDAGVFHYKRSRQGSAEIDRAAEHALKHCGEPYELLDFSPYGYDERQYCSPGFNLPVGCLMRSVWGQFPEYHTSADNLDFIKPEQLARSLRLCSTIVDILEGNRRYCNLNPYCEPQLGRRKLYPPGSGTDAADYRMAQLWVLNLSDGHNSLLEIAQRSGLPFQAIHAAAGVLRENGLLKAI